MTDLAKTVGNTPATKPPTTLQGMLSQDGIRKRFQEIMGEKAPAFISSIISATKATPSLMQCEPDSIISSAVIAATLDLPIQPSLGFAWMVPYNKREGQNIRKLAQFQLGWKGLVQLAMRTGQYKTINTAEVYEGELIGENRFTGEYDFNPKGKQSDKIIGYMAYFKLLNGYEKTLYWPKEKVEYHAKRFSKTFGSDYGIWNTDFDSMAMKTVLKALLSKFGILSVEMQTAIISDQAEIKDADSLDVSYPDNDHKITTEEGMVIDTNPTVKTTGQKLTEKAKEKLAKKEEPIQEAVVVTETPASKPVESPDCFALPKGGRGFDAMMDLADYLDERGLTFDKIKEKLTAMGEQVGEPDTFYKEVDEKTLTKLTV
jgi:recombination protein RecT